MGAGDPRWRPRQAATRCWEPRKAKSMPPASGAARQLAPGSGALDTWTRNKPPLALTHMGGPGASLASWAGQVPHLAPRMRWQGALPRHCQAAGCWTPGVSAVRPRLHAAKVGPAWGAAHRGHLHSRRDQEASRLRSGHSLGTWAQLPASHQVTNAARGGGAGRPAIRAEEL